MTHVKNTGFKDRIRSATEKYVTKQTIIAKRKRTNKAPEKDVEKDVLKWGRDQGWMLTVVEAGGTNPYGVIHVKAGFPDLVGLTGRGLFLSIELKAPGRRSNLRENQRAFLHEVISRNGFGVCIDSVERLRDTYNRWVELKLPEKRRGYLKSCLPRQRPSVLDFDL